MKKKLISLFVCLAMLLPNAAYRVSAEVTVKHFAASSSERNESLGDIMMEGGVKIFEYKFTHPENTTNIRTGIYLTRAVNPIYPSPFMAITDSNGTSKLLYDASAPGITSATKTEELTPGETFYAVVIMDLGSSSSDILVYVNDEKKYEAVSSEYHYAIPLESGGHRVFSTMHIYAGTEVNVYAPDSSYTIADFNYDEWLSPLSSEDDIVRVDNVEMKVSAGREEMTAGTLLQKLIIPDGTTVKITDGGSEVSSDTVLTNDMKIDVVHKFGKKVSYGIVTGFTPLSSEDYRITVELDGNEVSSAKISGIKAFTPVDEFLSGIKLGADGTEILGVEPEGEYVNEEMLLYVETVDGDTVPFNIELLESYHEFEYHGAKNKIRNLHGLFNGEKSIIKGTAQIPEGGVTENFGLYFEMDIKKAYPIQFNTESDILVYGHKAGKSEKNKAYDYMILTDAKAETADAYINGMKVLENIDISSQLSSDDDPYELVGDSYNPSLSDEFLLARIYSGECAENFFGENIAMLEAKSASADVFFDHENGATVNLFVDESYTLSDIREIIFSAYEGSVKYYDALGAEILSDSEAARKISLIEAVSKNGIYVNRYKVFFPNEIIKSTAYSINEEEKTIGELLLYAPVSELLNTLSVVNPAYKLEGIYRGEEKLESSTSLNEGDLLKLSVNDSVIDYKIVFVPDFEIDNNKILIPERTTNYVTVFEGRFTVPEEGFRESAYSVWYRTWAPSEGRSIFQFTTEQKLQIWNSQFQLEKGKTYVYSYIQDHPKCTYDFYLNGIKLVSGANYQHTISIGDSSFDNFWLRGPLAEKGGLERAYRVYSKENYIYKNDLSITSTSGNVEIKTGTANVINIKNRACSSVSDLLNSIAFKSTSAKENAVISGNGEVITDIHSGLITGMVLTVKAEDGFSADYVINVECSPITSWVFNVSDNSIECEGNITYYDFVRCIILADGYELVVKNAEGKIISSGNIENGMKAVANDKTYTISLIGAKELPVVTIDAVSDEIIKSGESYQKTINVSGSGITGVTVYLDGEKCVLGTSDGDYTFTKDNLTSGRHEIYAVAETTTVKAETEHLIFYAFEEETDRVRAGLQPVVINVRYLNSDMVPLKESEKISYEELKAIEIVFNKALLKTSITAENIALYSSDKKLEAKLSYEENTDAAYFAVIISDFDMLSSSSEYEIRISGNIKESAGYAAKDESKIIFRTSPKPFDVKGDSLVKENGQPAQSISGGDSIKAKVELTNTSLNTEEGLLVLTVFDGNRMVGYSITTFEIAAKTVSHTVETNTVRIHENASDKLTLYRYVWNSDINDLSRLLKQSVLK